MTPDINFYQDISSLETHYCSPNDFQNNFQCFLKDSFSVLHLNIRSINMDFKLTSNFALGRRHIFQQKFEFSTFRLPCPTLNKKKS